jgi:S1-C subfamily serine protease
MIVDSKQAEKESILALSRFGEDNQGSDLTGQESERKIADNLVAVMGYNNLSKNPGGNLVSRGSRGVGTGILLTTGGFVLTAYHNIREYIDDWRVINEKNPVTEANFHSWMKDIETKYSVVDSQRRSYPIDPTFWATSPGLDIALIKAMIPRKPEPINFKIVTNDLKRHDEIKLLGLRDQLPYNQYGRVTSVNYNVQINHAETGKVESTTYDTFSTDAYSVPGFSGGAFTTLGGEFAGLALYSQKGNRNKEIGYAGGARIKNIVDFVREVASGL